MILKGKFQISRCYSLFVSVCLCVFYKCGKLSSMKCLTYQINLSLYSLPSTYTTWWSWNASFSLEGTLWVSCRGFDDRLPLWLGVRGYGSGQEIKSLQCNKQRGFAEWRNSVVWDGVDQGMGVELVILFGMPCYCFKQWRSLIISSSSKCCYEEANMEFKTEKLKCNRGEKNMEIN